MTRENEGLGFSTFKIKNLEANPLGISRWFGRKILLKIRSKPA
jgi:hypothetical protein